MEFQKDRFITVNIEKILGRRGKKPTKEQELLIRNKSIVQRTLEAAKGKEVSEQEVSNTIKWLEKVSNYVPIDTEHELEEIVKIMVLLSEERAKLNELYDYPGLNLMKRVREGMIRYMVVLSEIRARQKEFLEYWFTDEYWITEWSRIILDLSPEQYMEKYGFKDVKAKDFLFLLELELATADDASKVDKPMVRLQAIENKDSFLIIPTETAAEEYEITVNRILKETVTFTEWVNDFLKALKLPK
ncbi:MAG: hypothetical protein JSW11_07840 [Candidatus Heimdallarchaeota archaeon]|nr:MAG: hypothetical protein JSW11_07840 [Candidatus Heimdallarchaeota archaeon]